MARARQTAADQRAKDASVNTKEVIQDCATGAIAGYAATKVMEAPAGKISQMMPEHVVKADEEARSGWGPPYKEAAARIPARVLGVELEGRKLDAVSWILHYLAAAVWTPVYMGLRRRAGLRPLPAGLVMGASQCLVQDEVITPLIGASPPNPDFPIATHARGLFNHLAYGLAVAGVVEAIWGLLGRRP